MLSDFGNLSPWNREKKIANITTPWNYLFDLKLDRTFSLADFSLTAYLYIQNIFNRKNVLHVYWRTGEASSDGFFSIDNSWVRGLRKNEEFYKLYQLINIEHRQHYRILQGGDLFGHPREIRFGLRIQFGDN